MSEDASAGTAPSEGGNRVFLVLIDESEEMHVALYFACRRAERTNGRIALLHVSEPVEFMHWLGVEARMREESREESEELLQKYAAIVQRHTGRPAILIAREGDRAQVVQDVLEEDRQISILVLAASTSSEGPGPVVSHLTSKGIGKVRIPITIVPGGLSDAEIEAIT